MRKGIIITLPRYDDTTEYISQWSFEIIEEAKARSIEMKKLSDEEVNRTTFEKVLSSLDFKMIVFNGHGSENCLFGHNNEVVVEEGVNHSILKGRIVYSRSCDSASSLGISCIEDNQDGCFIGYNLPFTFYIDHKWVANPRKDKVAGMFMTSSNLIPISLIKGNSAREANDKSKKQILKQMNKVLREKTKDSFLIAGALWNNYIAQELIGNEEAKL